MFRFKDNRCLAGWVSLQILNTFNKLRSVTNANLELIKEACVECSDILELRFKFQMTFCAFRRITLQLAGIIKESTKYADFSRFLSMMIAKLGQYT